MARIAEEDFTRTVGKCLAFGGDVDLYLCNDALISARPEAKECDRWMLCVNTACENHYGEGVAQHDPDWLIRS